MATREPRWVAVFLKQLERTGNVRVAASQAGIDFTSAYQRRKRHAEFAERWEGAVAVAKAMPPQPAPSPGLPSASPSSPPEGGEELVTHPDGKLIRVGPGRWSRRSEAAFLAALAETANVRRAAEAAGVSATAVYARRLKQAQFAEAWEMALDTGKAKLEAMLVEAAQRRFDPDTLPISDAEHQSFGGHPPDGRVLPMVSVGEALNIVKLKRSEPGRGPVGREQQERIADDAEVRRELAKRLRVFGVRVTKAQERGDVELCPECGQEIWER